MYKYDPEKHLTEVRTGLGLKGQIEAIIDRVCEEGYSSVIYVGIGGTVLAAGQVLKIAKQLGAKLPLYLENAADLVLEGHPFLDEKTLVIIASASGDTKEVVAAVDYVHKKGAKVLGYVETPGTPLAEKCDELVLTPAGETLFFYTVTLRLLKNADQFEDYDRFFEELKYLPEDLVSVSEQADGAMEALAGKIWNNDLTYVIGSGNLEDWAVCYGMCILEEMQWMRTRPVSCANFFHGTLEVIDRDAQILLFKGEDKTRAQAERVEKFVHTISANVHVIDTKDYVLEGISEEFRGLLSPFVASVVCRRLSVYLERERRHPLAIRRYYRRLEY